MSNSKVRCNICRNYFPAEDMYRTGLGGFGGVCSEECFEAYLEKYKAKRIRRKMHREMRYTNTSRIPGNVRDRVRRRDDDKCQWCGAIDMLQIHHVQYRSEGGPDNVRNLITLCDEHHRLAHSKKLRKSLDEPPGYQEILLLWLWLHYTQDQHVTVPAAFRHAKYHPEDVDAALAFGREVMAMKEVDKTLDSPAAID